MTKGEPSTSVEIDGSLLSQEQRSEVIMRLRVLFPKAELKLQGSTLIAHLDDSDERRA